MRPYSEVYTLYECQSIRGQFRGAGGLGNPGLGMPVQKQLAEKLQRLAASHIVRRIQQLGVLCKHLEPAKYLEYTGGIARTTSATKTAHRFEVLVVFEERRRARLVPSKNLLQSKAFPQQRSSCARTVIPCANSTTTAQRANRAHHSSSTAGAADGP